MHVVHALVTLAGTAWHVFRRPATQAWVPVIFAASLITLTTAFEWLRLLFYTTSATILNEPIHESTATRIDVRCKGPLRIFPGSYFHIFFPGRLLQWNILQSYPMAVLWHSTEEEPGSSESEKVGDERTARRLGFLVSHHGRPLQTVRLKQGQKLLLSGPYGQDLHLRRFESVMLAAKGAGILGVLSIALGLSAPADSVHVPKVNIFWSLEENAQEMWVADELRALQKSDVNNVCQPVRPRPVLVLTCL